MNERLLVIGSGMATARLLEDLVAGEYPGTITVVGEEPEASYNRILLSPLLCGEKAPEELPLLARDWYEANRIRLRTGARVVAIDLSAGLARLAGAEVIGFDRLVFATGSRPYLPDIPGVDARGVMGFRTLGDARVLDEVLAPGDPVVVIGGGLLGLEAAHGLTARGMAVTVVHRQPWLMNRQLDADGGEMLAGQLGVRGMVFRLGRQPVRVLARQGRVLGVELDDGEVLPAKLVLFAAGITPNRELASAAGLPCDRGILVDDTLATSDPRVYALGECCQLGDITFGLVAPVLEQAAVLAARLCGDRRARYRHRDTATQLKVSGIDLYSAGYLGGDGEGRPDQQVIRDPEGGVYRRLVFAGDRLVGAVLLGDRRDASWYGELIDSGVDVGPLRHLLVFGRAYCEPLGAG